MKNLGFELNLLKSQDKNTFRFLSIKPGYRVFCLILIIILCIFFLYYEVSNHTSLNFGILQPSYLKSKIKTIEGLAKLEEKNEEIDQLLNSHNRDFLKKFSNFSIVRRGLVYRYEFTEGQYYIYGRDESIDRINTSLKELTANYEVLDFRKDGQIYYFKLEILGD